jgi:TPR repeat protein
VIQKVNCANQANIRPAKETGAGLLMLFAAGLFFALPAAPALADDFENGLRLSIDGDYSRAAASFRKAADRGEAEAQFKLALMYEEGRGVARDDRQAVKWYLKAAEQDHALAQLRLGKMLFAGRGTNRDNVEAYKWFSIANAKNKRVSRMNLNGIASQMTSAQIAEAQLRARKWLEAHPEE